MNETDYQRLGEIFPGTDYGIEVDDVGVQWLRIRFTPELSRLLAMMIDILADCRWARYESRQLELTFGKEVVGD